jgi:large subunit ribosomal protein L6|uniref:Large ribosomal subunit protein uL6 n=1 Tax=Desulfobacca acetoxidans TaxID=60893 RepID=A0A7C5ALI8_9BACT
MSRIGKKPIPVPEGVKVQLSDRLLTVSGKLGTLSRELPPRVNLEIGDREIRVLPQDDSRQSRSFWGLTRTLVANMVTGVSQGFTRSLEIVGTGFKVESRGDTLVFSLGYSNPVEFPLPPGITAQILDKGTRFELKGSNKEILGQTAANIRALRPPDAYKGKGVRYLGEKLRRKVGKAGGR